MKSPFSTNRMLAFGLLALLVMFLGTACTSPQQAPKAEPALQPSAAPSAAPQSREVFLDFASTEITTGKIEETPDMRLHVLLPPSYDSNSSTRYPVLYYMHGYGGPAGELIFSSREIFEAAWAKGECPEFILVGIPGGNSMGGSFYVDSPATGNWQSMITKEVIPLVDRTYRTLAQAGMRMAAGFSMGGFGAWNLVLSAPALVGHAWACCPGALAPGGLDTAMGQWDAMFKDAYGAAFAPDLTLEEPWAAVPGQVDESKEAATLARWQAGFGDIEGKLAASARLGVQPLSIRFDIGKTDWYSWIPEGTRYTAAAMKNAGLAVEIQEWPSGHEINPAMVRDGLVPWIKKAFGKPGI